MDKCELCGEPAGPEMAEMYRTYNAHVTILSGGKVFQWADFVEPKIDQTTIDLSNFTTSGPVFVCPDCGTDGGRCSCPGLSVYCHAQCGLSRGMEIA